MTQNDFLGPLFSLQPIVVALITFLAGGGLLLLFAAKVKFIRGFLGQPQFAIGDLLLLPLVGFLVTFFYQHVDYPTDLVVLIYWPYITVPLALIFTALSAYRSFFIIKTMPLNIFILLHLIFYFLIAYILLNFLLKGILQLLVDSTPLLWAIYTGVAIAMAAHLFVLPTIFGFKRFPR